MHGYGYDGGSWMHGPWMFGGGGIGMLLWIVLIVLAVAFVIRLMSKKGESGRGNGALEILKERYARGEIEKDEFDRKKRDLA